jgi:NAD(P)-dependent dehydrogenase (short-subunit alcohol dehydrogenase family)
MSASAASDPSLASRRIVITGAGRGLGRALALTLAEAGADLVLLGRDAAALRSVADLVSARTGRAAQSLRSDLAEPASVRAACEAVLQAAPTVDVLINNAAPWLAGTLADASESEIAATIAATVTGTALMTRGLLPGLLRSRAADIVTIVSSAGLTGRAFDEASAVFHAAKHGQAGLCDRLRAELKPHGIRVAAIFPSDFDASRVTGPAAAAGLSSRDVVMAVVFAITAPRGCGVASIVLEDGVPPR